MLKKIVTKKNIAVFIGLIGVLMAMLAYAHDSCYRHYGGGSLFCDNLFRPIDVISTMFILSPLLIFSLLISVPAYFMREEVHTYWFNRMVKIYLPIACGLVFLIALMESGQGGGFGPSVGAYGTIITLLFSSIGFIVLSIIFISKKYNALKRKGK